MGAGRRELAVGRFDNEVGRLLLRRDLEIDLPGVQGQLPSGDCFDLGFFVDVKPSAVAELHEPALPRHGRNLLSVIQDRQDRGRGPNARHHPVAHIVGPFGELDAGASICFFGGKSFWSA